MFLMKNNIEKRFMIKTLKEDEDEVMGQQLVPLFPPPKALQDAPKMAPRMAIQQLGFME